MKRPTTATNSVFTAELDPTKDSRLLSHFGLVLLTSYCSVEAKLDPVSGTVLYAVMPGTSRLKSSAGSFEGDAVNTLTLKGKHWCTRSL